MSEIWVDSEVEFLNNNYLDMTINEIADILKKDFYAVKHKVKSLGLCGKNKKWTPEDIQFLKDNLDMPLKEMSKIMDRTVESIKTKHRKLGISKYTKSTVQNKEIYTAWAAMKSRCLKENTESYKNYGGRGITVCQEWIDNSEEFIQWALANGWEKGLSIDRIDNDGHYCPENCRWIDRRGQANNRRSNTHLMAFGETKTLIEWSRDERCKVTYNVLVRRNTQSLLTPEEMLTNPQFEAKTLTAFGETKTMKEWAVDPRCVVSESRIYKRIKRGMTPEDAISLKK